MTLRQISDVTRRTWLAWWPKLFAGLALALVACAGAILVLLVDYSIRAASLDLRDLGKIPERSVIIDSRGRVYSRIVGENRIVVPLSKVSRSFINALLAREDTRFYEHHGVDYRGIVRALFRDVKELSIREGGSTLTQQLARNSFPLGGPKSFSRKLFEAVVASRIESAYPKDKILEFYVNRIYFGCGVWGVETASQIYFGKSCADLTLGEAALLAGMIRSPNNLSPQKNFKGALSQRDAVLDRMARLGMVSQSQAEDEKHREIIVLNKGPLRVNESYALDAVQRELKQLLTSDQIDRGGLRIFTTIDTRLQRLAETTVEAQLERTESKKAFHHRARADLRPADREKNPDYLQGALVAIDNKTGGIVALVGGRSYRESQYNRALQARRQVGSTFKPFVYAAAVKKGMMPGTLVDDSPLKAGELQASWHPAAGEDRGRPDFAGWRPGNAKGENFGKQPAEFGLVQSQNTMTVRVGEFAGIDDIQEVATNAGLGQNFPKVPAIFLGAFESTLKDLTVAFSIFPNGGIRHAPYIIERIEDHDGNTLYQAPHEQKSGMEMEVAWVVSRMLEQVLDKGTGELARKMGYNATAAGKTGTTNDYRDTWFVGYTTSITCGVWVGFDRPKKIMDEGFASVVALPVWTEFMRNVPDNSYPAEKFSTPLQIQQARLCSVTGCLATSGCEEEGAAYSVSLPTTLVPATYCRVHGWNAKPPVTVTSYTPPKPPSDALDAAPPPAPPPAEGEARPVPSEAGGRPQPAAVTVTTVEAIPVNEEVPGVVEAIPVSDAEVEP